MNRDETFKSLTPSKKLSLLTMAIFVFAIWSLTFYANWSLREEIEQQISQQVFSTVSLAAKELNNALNERLKALEQVAKRITPAMLSNAAASQKFIEDRPVLYNMFNAGFYVTGIDGTAVATLPLSLGRVGINYMDQHHVAAALMEEKSTISKPRIGKMLKQPAFGIAVPIRDQLGVVNGAFVGVIDLSKPNFLDEITVDRYGKSGG